MTLSVEPKGTQNIHDECNTVDMLQVIKVC